MSREEAYVMLLTWPAVSQSCTLMGWPSTRTSTEMW